MLVEAETSRIRDIMRALAEKCPHKEEDVEEESLLMEAIPDRTQEGALWRGSNQQDQHRIRA